MKKQFFYCLLSLLLVAGPLYFSLAQDLKTKQKIDNWFHEQRFILADKNDDALLDRREMQRFRKEFVYFLSDRYFSLSDVNQDGHLSFGEMYSRRKSEYLYRYNIERNQLRKLEREHPELENGNLSYIKNHPALVASLFENLLWMYEHEELVSDIMTDLSWIKQHPQTLMALHKNIRWMAANPKQARRLYQDRAFTQKLPEFVAWRADHKRFIRSNSLVDRFYEISFIPEGVYIQR